jgi:hypothetical protein
MLLKHAYYHYRAKSSNKPLFGKGRDIWISSAAYSGRSAGTFFSTRLTVEILENYECEHPAWLPLACALICCGRELTVRGNLPVGPFVQDNAPLFRVFQEHVKKIVKIKPKTFPNPI